MQLNMPLLAATLAVALLPACTQGSPAASAAEAAPVASPVTSAAMAAGASTSAAPMDQADITPMIGVGAALYAGARHCGASSADLAALKQRQKQQLLETWPKSGGQFDAHFDAEVDKAERQLKAQEAQISADQRKFGCEMTLQMMRNS